MDHLGIGIGGGEFAPHVCARPIDLSAITIEHLFPVDGFTGNEGLPVRHLIRVRHDLFHVVTWAEAQHLERALERRRAEAGTNDRNGHLWIPFKSLKAAFRCGTANASGGSR